MPKISDDNLFVEIQGMAGLAMAVMIYGTYFIIVLVFAYDTYMKWRNRKGGK
jgi:hypothetical protein